MTPVLCSAKALERGTLCTAASALCRGSAHSRTLVPIPCKLTLPTSERALAYATNRHINQNEQAKQDQVQNRSDSSMWWEDGDTEWPADLVARTFPPTPVRAALQQQMHHNQQGYAAGSKTCGVSMYTPGQEAAFSACHAASCASPGSTDKPPQLLAAGPGLGTPPAAAHLDISPLLMVTPLSAAERHTLVLLWRRLTCTKTPLKSLAGEPVGPPLVAFVEARWGLPTSLLAAEETHKDFFGWLFTAVRMSQQHQDHQKQQEDPMDVAQVASVKDLLQAIRGHFHLQDAAVRHAQLQQQSAQQGLDNLLQQWRRGFSDVAELDILSSTYSMLLEIASAMESTCGLPGGHRISVNAEHVFPAATGPLMALARIYFARRAFSGVMSLKNKLKLVDLTNPERWFPYARRQKRSISLFLGPPNSGKTRRALDAIMAAPTGCYLGPLRLLAREVYNQLKAKGIRCSLITGPEKIIDSEATHVCSTVEAAVLDRDFALGVLDEVQLLGDAQRGPAWTRAFLGLRVHERFALRYWCFANALMLLLQVTELHVCGEETAGPLVEKLALQCGDTVCNKCTLNSLAVLKVEEQALPTDWVSSLQAGDCLLTFSVNACWQLKSFLATRGVRASVLYGQLPPDVRLRQTRKFNEAVQLHISKLQEQQHPALHTVPLHSAASINPCAMEQRVITPLSDPATPLSSIASLQTPGKAAAGDQEAGDSYPIPNSVLIATDAIGLGVNLAIRRIIFTSIFKYDGAHLRPLGASEIRQLAFRAGRFGGPWGLQGGFVCALYEDQLEALRGILEGPGISAPPLNAAALLPESWIFILFCKFSRITSHEAPAAIIQQFVSLIHTRNPYFIPPGALHGAIAVADLLKDIPLRPHELYIFCTAPVSVSRPPQQIGLQEQLQHESRDAGIRQDTHMTASHVNRTVVADDEISVSRSESTTATGTAAASGYISLPMQAALRSFAVSLAATRLVMLPPPFRIVRRKENVHQHVQVQQQESQLRHMCGLDDPPQLAAAAGVGFFDASVLGQPPEAEETEAAPAETLESLRAWETIYQVLDLYLWLADKLPKAFTDAPLAVSGKALAAEVIEEALDRGAPLQGLGEPDEPEHP
ncbi:uncharacterized protein LOC34618781 [Cyclospora cayetanensis]|uniref:Uncharacterized protein LOC34618781 n=1 Tax=Cyclospora cayetanensis TaxID=88456 RepID=A0A6P6S1J5_9EIME|nr:uncharacterized protein LOC34618781 [Cyclospora cayetanensis]